MLCRGSALGGETATHNKLLHFTSVTQGKKKEKKENSPYARARRHRGKTPPKRNETKRKKRGKEEEGKGREREKEGRSPPPRTLEADSTVDWRARLGLVFACPRRQARPRTTTHDRPISHGRTRPADGNRQCAIQTAASFCSEPFETSLRRKERKKERKKITYPKRIAKQQGARWRAN